MNLYKYMNLVAVLLGLTLYGCSNSALPTASTNNTASNQASYEVIITNLTAAQPIAPVAMVLHTSGYMPVILGASASLAIEKLAEGGDNAMLLSQANAHASVLTAVGAAGVLMPGASETITATVSDSAGLQFSLAGMLVNTNDGFAAVGAFDISNLAVGDSKIVMLPVYDAGTEANVETAVSMPGTGGVGFDAVRNDVGFVGIHRGVVTADDGLATSGLLEKHKFDNPALKVVIRRTS